MGNRIYMLIFVLLIAAVLGWASYEMIHSDDEEEEYHVAVILRDSDSDRSVAFRQGLEQGAGDFNLKINIISEDVTRSQVKEQVEKGEDGVIIDPYVDNNLSDYLTDNQDNVKFVLMNTDLSPAELFPLVSAGDERIGNELFLTVKEAYRNISDLRIALVCLTGNNTGEYKRFAAFKEALQTEGIEPTLEVRTTEDAGETLTGYLAIGGLDCVVAFDSKDTELCIDALTLSNNVGNAELFGEGYSEKIIYYLDKGTVTEVVLPNEFNIGYFSARKMYQLLSPGSADEDIPEIETFRVTRNNMYEPEIENIIFPIAQ